MGNTNPASGAADPAVLISRKTGDWWKDERRNWCAYCGIGLTEGSAPEKTRLTRDHVIPRAHKGRHVTIPCCRECNVKKGKAGLPEFMQTQHFGSVREAKLPNQWSLCDLWLVVAWAAVEQAREHADVWPANPPARAKAKPLVKSNGASRPAAND